MNGNYKILALLLAASIVFAGCVEQASPTPTTQPQITTPTATVQPTATSIPTQTATATATSTPTATASPTEAPEKEFEMTARQWEFQPSAITVQKGDRVKLRITSVDVSHGFKLPEFGVDERLEPGRQLNVDFIADKAGTFTFFCNVLCGSGHGEMRGTLVVEG